jgi:hypothetical protein
LKIERNPAVPRSSATPGNDEWKLLKDGPLNGKIGMSFALQWRFNFGRVFNGKAKGEKCAIEIFT